MKYIILLFLVSSLTVNGLSQESSPVSAAKKEALQKFLDSHFVVTAVPKEKEEEFYWLLEIFAEGRRPDEFVRQVIFYGEKSARLTFSNDGMHGGGDLFLKKESGKWILEKKYYRA